MLDISSILWYNITMEHLETCFICHNVHKLSYMIIFQEPVFIRYMHVPVCRCFFKQNMIQDMHCDTALKEIFNDSKGRIY